MSDGPPHLSRLNPEQHRAVVTTRGPLLVLAGAGSGKTRVLTRRIAHLLHEGVAPENVLAVTFTNKAAAEMRERLTELIGPTGEEVWVSTFHSTCARILRQDIEALGWTRRFSIYDDEDQVRLVKSIVRELGYDTEQVVPRDILSRIDHHKNRSMTPDRLVREVRDHLNSPLLRVWREYDQNLLASDALDFNDLIGHTVRLFAEHPDILEKWRERFQFLLVDEYQDTNQTQYHLLRMLAPEADANLAVVGDDDQSIYGFRGADVSNILNFEVDYPGATVIRLEQNYRSTGNILAVANAVVKLNADRLDKRLWTDSAPGHKVFLRKYETAEAEAEAVAKQIRELVDRNDRTYGEIAVIYRTNAIARTFEAALRHAGIPHKVVGGRKLYDRREIRDVVGYLRLVVNPADDAALLRVLNVPSRGIGVKTLEKLREDAGARGVPLLVAARSFAVGGQRGAEAVRGFVTVIDALTDLARVDAAPALVGAMLEQSGYAAMLADDDARTARERLANIQSLVVEAARMEPPPEAITPMDRLRWWLDRISLAGQDEALPDGGEVTLLTVHCAKGLEYPVVFVVHMMQGIFPHAKSLDDGNDAEERRLAYVAFTRAQQLLVVTRARQRSESEQRRRAPRARADSDEDDGPPSPRRLHLQEPEPLPASQFLYGLPGDVCAGNRPELDEAVEPEVPSVRLSGADPEEDERPRTATAARPPDRARTPEGEHLPDGPYALVEVTALDQLRPGTKVRHPARGFGLVHAVHAHPTRPSAIIDFGGGRASRVPVAGSYLQIVVE